jgi:hypothetical protein
MASDGNDRRVYVGNLPPDIRTKVIYLVFLNQLFSIRQGCSMLNVGFEILLRLFSCAQLNIVIRSIIFGFAECGSGFMPFLNPDPDPAVAGHGSGSSPRFVHDKIINKFTTRFFFFKPLLRTFRLCKHEISLIFFFWGTILVWLDPYLDS